MSALFLLVMLLEMAIAQCWMISDQWFSGISMVCCACAHYYLASMSMDRSKLCRDAESDTPSEPHDKGAM